MSMRKTILDSLCASSDALGEIQALAKRSELRRRLFALEDDTEGVSDEPEWRRDYRSGRMYSGSNDAVRLFGGRGGSSGFHGRFTRSAGRVRGLTTRV